MTYWHRALAGADQEVEMASLEIPAFQSEDESHSTPTISGNEDVGMSVTKEDVLTTPAATSGFDEELPTNVDSEMVEHTTTFLEQDVPARVALRINAATESEEEEQPCTPTPRGPATEDVPGAFFVDATHAEYQSTGYVFGEPSVPVPPTAGNLHVSLIAVHIHGVAENDVPQAIATVGTETNTVPVPPVATPAVAAPIATGDQFFSLFTVHVHLR